MTAYHDEHENEYDLRAKQAAATSDLIARAREEAAYLESENVSPLSTPTTLRDCAARIASLTEQVEELRNHVEVLQAKIDPDEHCAEAAEECAQVADSIAATHRSIGKMNLPAGGGPVIQEDRARVAESCAAAIRAMLAKVKP